MKHTQHRTLPQRIDAALAGFFRQSPVQAWGHKHPRAFNFLKSRLGTKRFTGLPLSIVSIVLILTIFTLLGVIQDYLATDPLIALDARLANLLFAVRNVQALSVFYGITLFGEVWIVLIAASILSGVLLYNKQRLLALGVWLALIPGEGVAFLGKLLFHRERPSFRAVVEDSFSFPSGHATTVVVFYGFVTYLCLRKVTSWLARLGITFGFLCLMILVDASRLYLGVHYLSDVLAGNLIGLASVLFAVTAIEWLSERKTAINWHKVSLVWLLPSFFCLIGIGVVLMIKAPLFSTTGERPQNKSIASSEILSLFDQQRLPRSTETLLGNAQEPLSFILIGDETCLVDVFHQAG
ncbi:hypothetical protein COV06_00390 [Candidatus Uhrbacteria bacterium CG10_big_fil_rev_8_21_14_0_10_50_16]|uniref:Phosphatidic acid phosphatase type 2/haloperoxidase domain-containing protein n=1 Tax=Candidatus Uhrbacteria bacterium CG10_big_fil_rev_8_21_14_0_10_50_16 TaxID=1975039 RepID=A0A2H0RN19_9BACT|nr:MAG: hypothetical protein COV06_00390 [Candidatus Uhrbacteria bacterium CG10_big_fil_rev_8_21_14_0_10_50_16]